MLIGGRPGIVALKVSATSIKLHEFRTTVFSRESMISSLTGFIEVSNSGVGFLRLQTSLALCFVALARPESFPWPGGGGGDFRAIADAARKEGNDAEVLNTGVRDLDCSDMEYEGLCRGFDSNPTSFYKGTYIQQQLQNIFITLVIPRSGIGQLVKHYEEMGEAPFDMCL